jgi:pimeloyl-ACP methyl ester carboxylesterase
MKTKIICAVLLIAIISVCFSQSKKTNQNKGSSSIGTSSFKSGYAPVNGLKMYYEIHGKGDPIILVHGAYSAIGTSFAKVLPGLAGARQVIAVELQGHGRTKDIDRPITYEQLADDISQFMSYLNIPKADLWGYSLGAGVCLQVYFRHPEKVNKMILSSLGYSSAGVYPEVWEGIKFITPQVFEGSIYKREYDSLAPDKKAFPELVNKLLKLDATPFDWGSAAVKAIKTPVMLIIGDADIVKPEHAVEMFRLLGGGVIGDMVGIPNSRLAILPATTHTTVMNDNSILLPMANSFLNAPVKAKESAK